MIVDLNMRGLCWCADVADSFDGLRVDGRLESRAVAKAAYMSLVVVLELVRSLLRKMDRLWLLRRM